MLRGAAWLALALALATCVAARGWVMGPVLWTGMMMLAEAAVAGPPAERPERRRAWEVPGGDGGAGTRDSGRRRAGRRYLCSG